MPPPSCRLTTFRHSHRQFICRRLAVMARRRMPRHTPRCSSCRRRRVAAAFCCAAPKNAQSAARHWRRVAGRQQARTARSSCREWFIGGQGRRPARRVVCSGCRWGEVWRGRAGATYHRPVPWHNSSHRRFGRLMARQHRHRSTTTAVCSTECRRRRYAT